MANSTFYITSDKVGDFCQRMHEAGLDVNVNGDFILVFFGGALPQQIHIASQRNYEEMLQDIIKKKEEME